MARIRWPGRMILGLVAVSAGLLTPVWADAACCYFSAQNTDILQPSQKVFITWDPEKKLETFTVQPKFEGNALDFGMVIPTPAQPKLHEMPRDFFKHLAVFSILKRRELPQSKLLPRVQLALNKAGKGGGGKGGADGVQRADQEKPAVVVLEAGVVGSLDYKIIEASRADDLFQWLKDNKYSYSGDEATLNHYVQKKWIFTVMKIDTMQMKKNKDGSFAGEVTPTRFQFTSDKLVYPLKITQISVKDKTEALFYVQAPEKMDLPGDMTYQQTWVPMLLAGSKKPWISMVDPRFILAGRGDDWLALIQGHIPDLMARNAQLGYNYVPRQRPTPNAQGRTPTTMEWARKLTADDLAILTGTFAYGEKLPDVDEGFTQADMKDPQKAAAIIKVIQARLAKAQKERPLGYLVRHAPDEDTRALQQLVGHLQLGLFITKFRKTFTREEMNDDLILIPARVGQESDFSEYEEMLPTSPP